MWARRWPSVWSRPSAASCGSVKRVTNCHFSSPFPRSRDHRRAPAQRGADPGGRRRARPTRIAAHAAQAGLPDPDGGRRAGGAGADPQLSARRRDPRHQDAGAGRARGAPPRQADRSRDRGGDDHRLRVAGDRQARADPRRLRVPHQALLPAGSGGRRAARARAAARRARRPRPGLARWSRRCGA